MSSSTSMQSDAYPYEVLSTADIVKCMDDYVETANSVLQLPTTTMRVLLNHFGWDKEKLLEKYYAANEQELDRLFQDAGVVNPNKAEVDVGSVASSSMNMNGGEEECETCFNQKPSSEMYGMKCGHRFCSDCWNHYLTTQIMEQGIGQAITCIAHDCKTLLDPANITKLVSDPVVRLTYDHLITNNFVTCNKFLKWCPSPGCNYAVKVQCPGNGGRPVTCKCKHIFCFQCTADAHLPIRCDMLEKWLEKTAIGLNSIENRQTGNWIAANTKKCPKCQSSIQKNGGCNLMHCGNCGAQFCWVCLDIWNNTIAGLLHSCNRFNENDTATNTPKDEEKSRQAEQRFLFYFNRYANHKNSLQWENKLYDSVKEKMAEILKNMSWIEVQFLEMGINMLCQCRQTLMYTYVFAFYVEKTQDNCQVEIFEGNQEDLQTATEKLSGFLEREVLDEFDSADNLDELKQQVQDMFRYCESRRQKLLDHVQEGHENSSWKFQD